ncbi:hypoxanthine-guanine phosphoribosyltransferase [Pokkaliibacter plantistimulans]|uniref:Hypoxanthine-guanine phosphoribosyltransferase n=1 Tax=Proteobacteria bacterium 228 TaxID=2083153 RepID=A0A2S5KNC7_9PROT|nr:hypoxanthine-guanine phosphoribosyltransferase [Pokkaliibacter plantistimulans]PPC76357.1 hypoxanthine-guanine phosphoribosyltransferase [Pokkaliibacter plantistimulans]
MSISAAEAMSVHAQADCLVSPEEIQTAYDNMAEAITNELADKTPLVLCVMRGGLIPAGQLLPRLDFPLELDYIHATRYGMSLQGGELEWRVRPATSVAGRQVLIIDDIFDEGHTLQAIYNALIAEGAARVMTATLINKVHNRKVSYRPDVVGVEVEDRFLYGCGMDYQGFFRNLNGIYAIKGH